MAIVRKEVRNGNASLGISKLASVSRTTQLIHESGRVPRPGGIRVEDADLSYGERVSAQKVGPAVDK